MTRDCDEANRDRWADRLPSSATQRARIATLAAAAGLSYWRAGLYAKWLRVRAERAAEVAA